MDGKKFLVYIIFKLITKPMLQLRVTKATPGVVHLNLPIEKKHTVSFPLPQDVIDI